MPRKFPLRASSRFGAPIAIVWIPAVIYGSSARPPLSRRSSCRRGVHATATHPVELVCLPPLTPLHFCPALQAWEPTCVGIHGRALYRASVSPSACLLHMVHGTEDSSTGEKMNGWIFILTLGRKVASRRIVFFKI